MKNLAAILLLFPVLASADPGPATQHLLDEPATLMDVGIIRLAAVIRNNQDLIGGNYEMATGISDVSLGIPTTITKENLTIQELTLQKTELDSLHTSAATIKEYIQSSLSKD